MSEGSFLPQNLAFIAKKMEGYSRNRFRLETTSADSATAGRIITINLPENSLCDMHSLAMWADVNTSNGATFTGSDGSNSNAVAKLPADTTSLIRSVEVYINGVQVQQGMAEYNTVAHILKAGRGNVNNDETKERVVNHSRMNSVVGVSPSNSNSAAIDDLSVCIDKWYGFLNECSTRFLPTDLLGAIQIRITLADNSVLSPNELSTDGLAISDASNYSGPVGLSYTMNNMYFTIDTISLDPMYSMAVRDMLQREQFVPLNYKEYYTFQLDGQTGTSYTNRFSLSSTSIDKIYAVQRPSTYNSEGLPAIDLTSNAEGDRFIAKFFEMPLYDSATNKNGTYRYNFSINNIKHPQYQARALEAARDLAFVNDKLHDKSPGYIPTTLSTYKAVYGIVPLTLCHPDQPISVQSGYNSKGINTQLTFEATGLSSIPASYQSFVVVETTPQLRIASGKNLAVAH